MSAASTSAERSTPWTVAREEGYCRLNAEFGNAKDHVAARLRWYGPGDTFDLTLTGSRLRKTGAYAPLKLDFGFGPIEKVATTGKVNYRPTVLAPSVRIVPALANGDPRALKRLSVQFRGMGVPEEEVVVTGTVTSVEGDRVVIDTEARQGENTLIRNAQAELELT